MSAAQQPSQIVVAGVDATPAARDAAALGQALGGDSLLLATVVAEPRLPLPAALRGDDAQPQAEQALGALRDATAPAARTRVVAGRSAARALHELAEQEPAAVVVLGSSRRAHDGEALAGRSARQLLHGAPCAVALAARGLPPAFALRRIAVGVDGSPEGAAALAVARELARRSGAVLQLVAVADESLGLSRAPLGELAELAGWDELVAQRREQAQRILDDALARLAADGAGGDAARPAPAAVDASGEVRVGDPPEQLAAAAAGADLLVLGSRQWGALAHVVIGSTAEELLRGAPCSLLLVPRPHGA